MDVRIDSLCVERGGVTVLADVSISLSSSTVVAICGPNGSGKSTLLHTLAGDLALWGGRILFDNVPLQDVDNVGLARRRAVLPQQLHVPFDFSGLDIVRLGRLPWRHRAAGDDDAVAFRALTTFEADDLAARTYPTMSGGEQQRVQLARVWAQLDGVADGLVLLDEPTSALDPKHQHLVFQRMRERATTGACVVAVVHDLQLARTYADHVVVLRDGGVVVSDEVTRALTPQHLKAAFDVEVVEAALPNGASALVVRPPPAAPSTLAAPLPGEA